MLNLNDKTFSKNPVECTKATDFDRTLPRGLICMFVYIYFLACVFSVAIYNIPDGSMTAMFEGQSGGITHVSFSKDGNYLFAGGRKVRHCLSVPLFKA